MTAFETPRIAYLTGHYPAISHTFILREITALRALGLTVDSYSIRKPDMSHLRGAPEQAAADETFYVLNAAKRPATFLSAQLAALRNPRRYFAGLKLALKTGRAGLKGLLYQLFYFAEAVVLAQKLTAQKTTHLHNHFADSSANVAMLAATLADIPFSYTLHGPAELFEPTSWHLRTKTARAAFVACISHFCRSQAMYFSDPDDWGKLRIIHCGVIPDHYTEIPKSTGKGMELVFVGRLTAIKGIRVLFEAFAKARETCPDLHLTLVGDGDERPALEELAVSMGDAVTFAGFRTQEEVATYLAQADVFVLPSFAEGLPVVLMEAMASAKPVITTQLAGVAELVTHEKSGFIVPASDAATLAARICDLYANPALREEMGQLGRQTVKDAFDINAEAARMASLFVNGPGDDVRPEPYRGKQ